MPSLPVPPAYILRRPSPSLHRAWLLALLASAALVVAAPVRADEDTERESLARIASEIDRVKGMAAEAAQRAPTGQRVKFRYEWLIKDLQLLQDGVNAHVDAPRQPRPVEPLRGDYRQ